ncbi:S8 family peptidase [Bacillus toyonensis]|uniref:S8 family peptidase n=1 Tax=Bacillus toyonensis TaxID=155322 RepID=UPI000BEC86BE|nr:S8 family peptidase [Bacillus toyonensis]PEC65026.1 peptidase S8 [Bacillus toyonensis]
MPENYKPRIVIKFHDKINIPYQDNAHEYIDEQDMGPWKKLVDNFPGITIDRYFTTIEPSKLQQLIQEIPPNNNPTNFMTYFVITCPLNINPEDLAKELSSWESVDNTYVESGPTPPPLVNPDDDPRSINEGYLDAAPTGIDARFAWNLIGGDGQGIQFIDLEQGWNLTHEDLVGANITIVSGVNKDFFSHGTSVLGEVVAVDNSTGCIGIAPSASTRVVSQWRTESTFNTADAILSAISVLNSGDVLLLEAQTTVGTSTFLPVEVEQAVFEAIKTGTDKGIIIIEAAGNGQNDLDSFTDSSGKQILNRNSPDFKDSGAIMVGAASSNNPHTRMNFSNYGSRIDCYAWGENIDTLDGNVGENTKYTSNFGGTSGASPIIAGAALSIQGIAKQWLPTGLLTPQQMRSILSDPSNGTKSHDPDTDRIGVMPDIRKIVLNPFNLGYLIPSPPNNIIDIESTVNH